MSSKPRSYSCHLKSVDLSNIELVFLPANTTSHVQPLDHGIIANFKRHYRYLYTTNWLCPAIEEGETLSKISMRPALQYCVKAWGMVTPRTISRCFRHAGFKNPAVTELTPEEEEEENMSLADLALRMSEAGRPHTVEDLDQAFAEEEGFDICGEFSDADIVQSVEEIHNPAPEVLELSVKEPR